MSSISECGRETLLFTGLVVVLFFIVLSGYCSIAVLSDNREYSKLKLDYWLLTPSIIRSVGEQCSNEPTFLYSAEDGTKPMVSQVKCMLDSEAVVNTVLGRGYAPAGPKLYRNLVFELSLDVREGDNSVVTLIELQ